MYFIYLFSIYQFLNGLFQSKTLTRFLFVYLSFSKTKTKTKTKLSEKINEFLTSLAAKLKEPLQKEIQLLTEIKLKATQPEENTQTLQPYDTALLVKLYRDSLFSKYFSDSSELRKYFSLGNCLQAFQDIIQNLFNVELRWVSTEPGELWAPYVYKIEVIHRVVSHKEKKKGNK